MFSFGRLLILLVLLWASLYTGSFGLWTWKRKNKVGSVAVFLISVTVLVLPIYMLFFRY